MADGTFEVRIAGRGHQVAPTDCWLRLFQDLAQRDERKVRHVSLVRLEQLYPFPSIALSEELEAFKHCEFVWCQEEPKNMGAWTHEIGRAHV